MRSLDRGVGGGGREAASRRDRPMIFSALMVKALLAGRKTQTRRVLKPQPNMLNGGLPLNNGRGAFSTEAGWKRYPFRVGDRLWVKEAHMFVGGGDPGLLLYRATCLADAKAHGCENLPAEEPKGWRSPLFMPRALSRLTLIVENVKVERLQDISEEDAIAEGARRIDEGFPGTSLSEGPNFWTVDLPVPGIDFSVNSPTAAGCYRMLWEHIYGDGAWDANPWICALSFRVIPKNIDTLCDTPRPTKSEADGGRG